MTESHPTLHSMFEALQKQASPDGLDAGNPFFQYGWIAGAIRGTVNELLTMHADTGIDLSDRMPHAVALIQTVYPDFEPIPDGQRTVTAASAEYLAKRRGGTPIGDITSEPNEYHYPYGRDTFRGAADWKGAP